MSLEFLHTMFEEEEPPSSRYPWSVLVVGIEPRHVEECAAAATPIPIVFIDDPTDAPKRMLQQHPIVVVVGDRVPESVMRDVRTRASIIRASLVMFEHARPHLADAIREGITNAETARVAARTKTG